MIEPDHSRLSIVRPCQLVSIARSSHYYAGKGESPLNLALMRLIDEQYLRTPWYGSRQMARHLRRQGYRVGRKRIRRLMRQMGLMAIYRKPRTSKPNPAHRIYPYLLRGLRIDQPNHVWCADVTYIPMRRGFQYLVVIMDSGDAYGALLAPVEHPGQRLLCRGPAGGVGQVRQPGGFQHGPGMPIHQRGFHLCAETGWGTDLDGRQGAADGQRLHRTPVALSQVRVRLPARFPGRAPSPPGHRYVAAVFQRGTASLNICW